MRQITLLRNQSLPRRTLIRFTRKLGLNGYTEFKLILSADLTSDTYNSAPVAVTCDDDPLEIYQKLAIFTTTSIESTLKTLVKKDLETVVDLIHETSRQKNRIYLSGMGASTIIASELQIKLMRLNIPTIFFEDTHLQLESNLSISKQDLLICFTTLGKSIQSHQFIQLANESHAKVILFTQYGNEKLAKKATVTLFTSSVENNFRLASQTAIIVQSMVIDTIFLALALKNLPKITKEVEKTKSTFANFRYYTP